MGNREIIVLETSRFVSQYQEKETPGKMFYEDETPEWIKRIDREVVGYLVTIGISIVVPIIVIHILSQ